MKAGLAQMLKGGVIMDVTNVEEARIAEEAGACAVMALERVPADIRRYVTASLPRVTLAVTTWSDAPRVLRTRARVFCKHTPAPQRPLAVHVSWLLTWYNGCTQ